MTEELPAAGGTTPAGRRDDPPTADTVNITEAVKQWAVSERTLRRRLLAGEVPGAHKVAGTKGETWRIPKGALDGLMYARRGDDKPAEAGTTADAALVDVIAQLQSIIERDQKALVAARTDHAADAAQVARLEERLRATAADVERERERADKLDAALAEARKPRRWWRR